MRTSEVLNRTADLIQERGWRQGPAGWSGDSPKGLCLEGGLAAAMGMDIDVNGNGLKFLWNCPAYNAVHNYLNRETGRYLWSWNDAGGRTAEQVIETLRACALIEEAKENTSIENKEEVSA